MLFGCVPPPAWSDYYICIFMVFEHIFKIYAVQVGSIQDRVRDRGFYYIGEGVRLRGTDIGATRAIIDTVKVNYLRLDHTINLIRWA